MKNQKVFLVFILLLSMFLTTMTAIAAEATGTLYYLEGGTGGGILHIYTTGGTLLRLHYSEYEEIGFHGNNTGYGYGAIWNIRYHKSSDGLVLDMAKFTGKFDEAVRAADELIRLHYAQLSHKEYEAAYDNLSPAWHRSQSYNSFVKGFKNLPFSQYADSPPSYALKIIGQNSKLVLVLVDTSYFIEGEGSFFRFEVVKINGQWYIDKVDKITYKDWEES